MTSIEWTQPSGVTSEVGTLRTVLLHRPGRELSRLDPDNSQDLLFDGMPWVAKAQREHDEFAALLRSRDVHVLYLETLLAEVLAGDDAREVGIEAALDPHFLPDSLRPALADWMRSMTPGELAPLLMAGVLAEEIPDAPRSLLTVLDDVDRFVITPLPNLYFTRDSSAWIGANPAITSLHFQARKRENQLTELVYSHHDAFSDHRPIHHWSKPNVEGGDVLVIGEKALAIGVGERTSSAGAEALAREAFAHGYERVVLVPLHRMRAMMHLDTVCTFVDRDAISLYGNVADTLRGVVVTESAGALTFGDPVPVAQAFATALDLPEVRVIGADIDAHTSQREQWDDGNNTLAIAPGVVVAYERNEQNNARLRDAGVEVLTIDASELGSGRGGPRCMSCPIQRDPA